MSRIGDALRRRLRRPGRGAPPATVPGLGSGEETALAAAARAEPVADEAEPAGPAEDGPDAVGKPGPDAGARIDAARERLRAKIEPPPPEPGEDPAPR